MNIFLKKTLKTLVARIKNYIGNSISSAMSNLATVATTGDYEDLKNRTHYEGFVNIVDEDNITLFSDGTSARANVTFIRDGITQEYPLDDYSQFALVLTKDNAKERIVGSAFSSGQGGLSLSFGNDYALVFNSSSEWIIAKNNTDEDTTFDNIHIETRGIKLLDPKYVEKVPVSEENLHSHGKEYIIPFIDSSDSAIGSVLKAIGGNNNYVLRIITQMGNAVLECSIPVIFDRLSILNMLLMPETSSSATAYLPKQGGLLICDEARNVFTVSVVDTSTTSKTMDSNCFTVFDGVTATVSFQQDDTGKMAIYKGSIKGSTLTMPSGTLVVNDNQYVTYSGGVLTVPASEYCEFEYNSYTKVMKLVTYLSI